MPDTEKPVQATTISSEALAEAVRPLVAEIERLRAGLREIMGTPGMPEAYYRNRAESILEDRPDV